MIATTLGYEYYTCTIVDLLVLDYSGSLLKSAVIESFLYTTHSCDIGKHKRPGSGKAKWLFVLTD